MSWITTWKLDHKEPCRRFSHEMMVAWDTEDTSCFSNPRYNLKAQSQDSKQTRYWCDRLKRNQELLGGLKRLISWEGELKFTETGQTVDRACMEKVVIWYTHWKWMSIWHACGLIKQSWLWEWRSRGSSEVKFVKSVKRAMLQVTQRSKWMCEGVWMLSAHSALYLQAGKAAPQLPVGFWH